MSDVPELIEPINITVKRLNKADTVYSSGVSGRREIVNAPVFDQDVVLPAQVVFGDNEQTAKYNQLGANQNARGYMVLRYQDVQAANISIKAGDKITKLGQLNTKLFFLHDQGDPAAHFASIGGFTLFRMFFTDRDPGGK